MTVQIVTDSSCCLTKELAEKAGITVLDLHVEGEGEEQTTSSLSSLELTASYARLMERGRDAGVLALHLSKQLSATYANACVAAGVFDGQVKVLDTKSIGMVLGFAALSAAEVAREGADLDTVVAVAEESLKNSSLWLYVHQLDVLRKGGRLSVGQALLTSTLAIKPILQVTEGKLTLAAKTRTQAKAMDRVVDLVRRLVIDEAVAGKGNPRDVQIAVHHSDAEDQAVDLSARLGEMIEQLNQLEAPTEPPEPRPHSLRRQVRIETWKSLPQVEASIVRIPEVLQLHVGQGALGVAATLRGAAENTEATEAAAEAAVATDIEAGDSAKAAADKSAETAEAPDAPVANGEKAEDNGAESSDTE